MLKNDGGDVAHGLYLWFMQYDQSLIDAGGVGVTFSIINDSMWGFDMQARGGDTIQISRSFFYEAVNYHKAALLGHEITHIYQGEDLAYSQVGEASAHYIQSVVLEEFGLLPQTGAFRDIYDSVSDAGFNFSDDFSTIQASLTDINSWYGIVVPSVPISHILDSAFKYGIEIGILSPPKHDYSSLIVEPVRVYTGMTRGHSRIGGR